MSATHATVMVGDTNEVVDRGPVSRSNHIRTQIQTLQNIIKNRFWRNQNRKIPPEKTHTYKQPNLFSLGLRLFQCSTIYVIWYMNLLRLWKWPSFRKIFFLFLKKPVFKISKLLYHYLLGLHQILILPAK